MIREMIKPADWLIQTRASDVPYNEIRWLWKHWIPLGALTILEGDPGLGKSTILCDIAAHVTRGEHFPFVQPDVESVVEYEGREGKMLKSAVRGSVVMLSAEDDAQTTIAPRLTGARARLEDVYVIEAAGNEDELYPRGLILPLDVPALEAFCLGLQPEPKLIIVDPIMAYLDGGTDTFKDHEVRRSLLPLQRLATKLDAAVLICRHLNKAARGKSGIASGGGSIAFTGAARSVIGCARWDTEWVQFESVKSNLGPKPPALQFRIHQGVDRALARAEGFWLDEEEYHPSVRWREQPSGDRIVLEGDSKTVVDDVAPQQPLPPV